MIVTLAGHVDHGKTTLVRELTGTDTDRLAEEKRRGLTIDLGFAYLPGDGEPIGFVDVPGHHRFIHNMVAGVAAMQHALLVIAADDGPMPQSREHLQILELLGVREGTVALTKCDRVTPARIEAVREEIARLLAGSFLENAPILETAAGDSARIAALRARLQASAEPRSGPAEEQRPFRLAVDRVFTLKGSGVVVTGTVHAGAIAVDEEVHVFPTGRRARVRDLRVQNQPARRASIGDRTAINLAGVDSADLARGHWLSAHPDPGHASIVVELRVLDDFPRAVRHWTPVHVYHATSHTTARLALLDGSRVEPGATARAELVLDQPLLAKRGDRIIVRDHALERTLGGGGVLDNRALPGRRRSQSRLRNIAAVGAGDAGSALDALLAIGPVEVESFRGLWDLTEPEFAALVSGRPATARQGLLVGDAAWQQWREALAVECRERHAGDPTLQGLRENDFDAVVPAAFRGRVLADLVADGTLEQQAGRFRPASHRAALSAAERALMDRLQPLLDQRQPPSLGDIGRELRIPLARLQGSLKPLVSKGELIQINDKRVYLPRHVDDLATAAEGLSARGPFSARDFRDATGIGRNVAIDLLEFFDARGFTRRQGDERTVVGERSRLRAKVR